VIRDVGLCILMHDLLEVGDSMIYPGDGAAQIRVSFRMVVFRPLPGEILQGRIRSCSEKGLFITLGFFEDIVVPPVEMQPDTHFDQKEQLWVWKYVTILSLSLLLSLPPPPTHTHTHTHTGSHHPEQLVCVEGHHARAVFIPPCTRHHRPDLIILGRVLTTFAPCLLSPLTHTLTRQSIFGHAPAVRFPPSASRTGTATLSCLWRLTKLFIFASCAATFTTLHPELRLAPRETPSPKRSFNRRLFSRCVCAHVPLPCLSRVACVSLL
jgi:hypothetical protein